MTKAQINNLELQIPEGFRLMEHGELEAAYQMRYECMWGARNEERHVLVAVIWKESGALLRRSASPQKFATRVQKTLAKRFKAMGYHDEGLRQNEVAGREAWGFSYGYTLMGQDQACEATVVQDGTCTYTIYYYTRAELAEQNRPLQDQIMASATFCDL